MSVQTIRFLDVEENTWFSKVGQEDQVYMKTMILRYLTGGQYRAINLRTGKLAFEQTRSDPRTDPIWEIPCVVVQKPPYLRESGEKPNQPDLFDDKQLEPSK